MKTSVTPNFCNPDEVVPIITPGHNNAIFVSKCLDSKFRTVNLYSTLIAISCSGEDGRTLDFRVLELDF